MNQPTIKKISLAIMVAALACGTLMAQQKSGSYKGAMGHAAPAADSPLAICYSNLVTDPCTGMKYDVNNGFLLIGPSNCGIPGSTQWLAAPFISSKTQPVTKVQLSVTNWGICTPTSNKFTVQIYDDANCNGLPGNPIGSAVVATSPAAPPALAQANFSAAGVSVTAGAKYWVVLTTSSATTQTGTTAVWWESNYSIEPYNLNDGGGWNPGFLGGPGGFLVQ